MSNKGKGIHYSDRRLVYLLAGLPHSGKTAKGDSILDHFRECRIGKGNAKVDSFAYVKDPLEVVRLKNKFLDLLKDSDIRKIIVDGSNTSKEVIDWYIESCEAAYVESAIVLVGHINESWKTRCLPKQGRELASDSLFKACISDWREYMESRGDIVSDLIVSSSDVVTSRLLDDTRLIAILKSNIEETPYEVRIGLDKDRWIRGFYYKTLDDAYRDFYRAKSTAFISPPTISKLKVWRFYSGSFQVPTNTPDQAVEGS